MFSSRDRFLLALVLGLYLLLGVAYSVLVPVFEASDELSHYPLVQHLATHGLALPTLDPASPGLWKQEGGQPPLYYFLAALGTLAIDTADFPKAYQLNPHADIGIIPLRKSSGTDIMLPTKLLEYVLTGIPAIVPRTPTIQRYFDSEMVEFFEAEQPESLADSLVRLVQNDERRAEMANRSSERFANVYRWESHKQKYVNLVNELIDRKSGGRPKPGS